MSFGDFSENSQLQQQNILKLIFALQFGKISIKGFKKICLEQDSNPGYCAKKAVS